MIAALLLAGHGVLGALALPTHWLGETWRRRILVGLCVAGAALGAALIVFEGSFEQWRTVELPGSSTVAGAAVLGAWLVAAVSAAPAGRSVACALTGVGCSALGLAVTNEWVVPFLLFWICSSLALATLAASGRGAIWVWVALFASDVALAAALVGNWFDDGSWQLPEQLEGWPFYVLVLATVLRGGAVPLVGAWGLLERPGASAVPLLAGGAFALLPVALGGPGDPWVAAGAFLVAVVVAVIALSVRIGRRLAVAAAAPVATLLGLALTAPTGVTAAGVAAVAAATALSLWPAARGEAGRERVIALLVVPPVVASAAAVASFGAAIERTISAEDIADKAPWTLALILGPVAIATNLALAARLLTALGPRSGWFGRLRNFEASAAALLVTRLVALGVIALALLPGGWIGVASPFAAWDERRAALYGGALVLAAGAAWWAARRARTTSVAHETAPVPLDLAPLEPPRSGTVPARLFTVIVLLLALAAIATVGWLTFEGLRLGFL